jgi:hypothetical protein
VNYWDIGVRDDRPDTEFRLGIRPVTAYSILAVAVTRAPGFRERLASVIRQYCNGSRLPPEGGGLFSGFNVPPGRGETTGLYPVFALNQITPAATVDEGNNWINLGFGPLSLANAATAPGTGLPQAPLGDYSISTGSPAIDTASSTVAPNHDFFGRPRPIGAGFDIGAVELAP